MDELNIKQMRRDLSKEELNKEEMNEEEELWTIILECLGCFEPEKETFNAERTLEIIKDEI